MTEHRLKQMVLSALLIGTMGTAYAATAADFEDTEYKNSTGLATINAATAYALGYTGKGITLGEVDTGVLLTHPELAGKTISEVYTDGYVVDWNEQYHGTHVAGIMAADRNGKGMEGVAFDANLAAVGVLFTDPEATATAMASLEQRNDVKIINNSWNAPLCTYYELQAGTTITDLQKQLMGDAMIIGADAGS